MKTWKETVRSSNTLCIQVCQEHRELTLEAKNCDGLDCDECQLGKQAEISFKAGVEAERKRIIKWGEEECPHPRPLPPFHVNTHYKRTCLICWQSLKEE